MSTEINNAKNDQDFMNNPELNQQLEEQAVEITRSIADSIHLTDDEKKVLYEKIYEILESGGIFINADLSLGETPFTEQLYKNQDTDYLEKNQLPEEEKQILKNRRKLDKPSKISDTIKWYKEIGFKNVDVYYKYYRYYVIAGVK
jgi:tRNA (cmo5U34)-methyltransferase